MLWSYNPCAGHLSDASAAESSECDLMLLPACLSSDNTCKFCLSPALFFAKKSAAVDKDR